MRVAALLAGSVLFALTAACSGGGGGSGGKIVGLTAPSTLQIVTPVSGSAPTAVASPASGVVASAMSFPAASDYENDSANVHVYDPAVEPLQIINNILCFMGRTGASELVNVDPYIAQVDVAACEDGSNQSSAGSDSGQSSSDSKDIQLWTVTSERASSSAPQIVELWVPAEEPGAPRIFVRVSLTESVSATKPFGAFEMSFAGANDVSDIATPEFIGHLATKDSPSIGDVGFTFYENRGDTSVAHGPGDESYRVQVNVEMSEDQTEGWAHILSSVRYNFGGGDSGELTQEFEVAFDATHFLRATDGGAAVAYEREEFTSNVWAYNLYHADGAEAGDAVDLDGGFGIRNDDGVYGWASYYGIWMPDGVELAHGEVVTSESYGVEESELVNLTVFKAPGRLVRYAKETLDLVDLDGQSFEWWTWDNLADQSNIYEVQYFTGTSQWKKVATIDPTDYSSTAITPAEVIDTSMEGVLDMWSDGLGGPVVFVDGETSITFYERSFVDGSDEVFDGSTVLTLYAFDQVLKTEMTAAEAEDGDIFLATAPNLATPYELEFRETDLTLHLDTDGMGDFEVVGLADGQEPSAGPNTWGMSSGPLVTPAVAATLTSVYDGWNADEFFVWETGHNDWNQFTGLKGPTDDFVEFDEPLTMKYVHSTAADLNENATYDGVTFFLQYEGAGSLHGFPYRGVDLDGDSNSDRWYPAINLVDCTMLTDSEGNEYVVKAIEIEQFLAEDGAYAGSLTVAQAGALVLPDGTGYATPDIGEEPDVDDAPRVIDGVLAE